MEAVAVAVSVASMLVAVAGTWLSNKRSKEALAEARKAAAASLWSAVQDAVQRFVGFDPSTEHLGDRLANLRIAMIALVDELDDWTGLDAWLEAEHTLGATLGRQAMARAKPGDTVDERLRALDPYQTWAQVLGGNLRRFRSQGYDAATAAKLRDHALEVARQIHETNGWVMPPTANPAIKPLEP